MDSINLTRPGQQMIMFLDGVYEINDPTGQSVYNNLRTLFTEEYITENLNKSLIWETNLNGLITITFPLSVDRSISLGRSFFPSQLPNLFALLGAIYTFYSEELTEEKLNDMNHPPFGRMLMMMLRGKRDIFESMNSPLIYFSRLIKDGSAPGFYSIKLIRGS